MEAEIIKVIKSSLLFTEMGPDINATITRTKSDIGDYVEYPTHYTPSRLTRRHWHKRLPAKLRKYKTELYKINELYMIDVYNKKKGNVGFASYVRRGVNSLSKRLHLNLRLKTSVWHDESKLEKDPHQSIYVVIIEEPYACIEIQRSEPTKRSKQVSARNTMFEQFIRPSLNAQLENIGFQLKGNQVVPYWGTSDLTEKIEQQIKEQVKEVLKKAGVEICWDSWQVEIYGTIGHIRLTQFDHLVKGEDKDEADVK